MAATKEDISRWFDTGVKKGATHLIVLCDTFDHGDYPKYVMPGDNTQQIVGAYNKGEFPMQKVMEVYRLSDNKEKQLNEHRAFNI